MTSGGNRCATIAADVTVPDVTSTRMLSARRRSISGSDRQHFADAGAVQPDQRSARPRDRGSAAPLADPLSDPPCRA